MESETQHWLDRVGQVKNEGDGRGGLVKKATRFFNQREKRVREDELRQIEQTLSPENVAKASITAEGRANFIRRRNYLKKELEECSPPDQLPGEAKDALSARQKQIEEEIRQGMPPHEVMWRSPAGGIDLHRKWLERNKFKIQVWKNIKRVLNPHDDSVDLSNIESVRPTITAPGQAASFMTDARLPGNFAMSALAKENWPLGEPKVDTPLKQAERREAEERELEETLTKTKQTLSEVEELKQELQTLVGKKKEVKRQRQQHIEAMRERARIKREEAKEAKAQQSDNINV